MEQLSYLEYLVFSLFSTKTSQKTMTVFHILNGKRTASILYQAELYQLSAYFGLFPTLKKETYQRIIEKGQNLEFLVTAEDGADYLLLSSKGSKVVGLYFAEHFVPKNLDLLQYGRWIREFWRRIGFASQVLSEVQFENTHYFPIEKEWRLQVWIKQWLHQQKEERKRIAEEFGREWLHIGQTQSEESMTVLVGFLTGHQVIGQTTQQIATECSKETSEIAVILLDGLSQMATVIRNKPSDYPLFYQILSELEQSVGSVSPSVRKTIEEVERGISLHDITKKRRLKLSTVSEHLIEYLLVYPTVAAEELVQEQPFLAVSQLLKENPTYSYSEMQDFFSDLPFYVYRLAQIERWRKRDDKRK